MATSGTVATTVIDVVKILDHAVRRCGQSPAVLTPEQVESATDNLYLILTALRGINLWAVTRQVLGLNLNQVNYALPEGTITVLEANYRTAPPLAFTADTTTVGIYKADFGAAAPICTLGMLFNTSKEYKLVFEVSADGTTWSTIKTLSTFTGYAGKWSWNDIDPAFATRYFRIRDTAGTALDFNMVRFSQQTHEVPMTVINRNNYASLPNKVASGTPLQYYFDRQTTPVMMLYPMPNDQYGHLVLWTHRQVQDVGALSNKLELPERWLDAVIWLLARALAFELPQVDEKRRVEVIAMAAAALKDAEDGEVDGAPIYIQPNISGYTA